MIENKYVLITGGTSGIGYELARVFAENGYNLVLVARTEDDLNIVANEFQGLYGIRVMTIAKDLFQPFSAFELYDEVKAKGITIDILVNDAGQGVYGRFIETDIHQQLDIIQLNISSLTVLTYLFLKEMVARNDGKILQLASIVSEIPSPLQAVYGATKQYILSFTEALINEVKDTNVTLTALQPGATDTDFFNKAGAQNSKLVTDQKLADPREVALDGYNALMKGDDKVVSGFKNKVQSVLSNILPDTVLAENMRKQSEEDK
ncbi:SDR family oxidoreductase [Chryseolinea sp. H1M3-3]|uniref:SDR family NAD(P)-dependent oxidoreductase n=1 Tax=Chryseolinea sp. H1M3-3 TaxID=3034144 RepID=UPI0023EB0081|nr:SDR family oxidoreductase [Chryseolinea sp. H1M3-3]